MLDDNIRDDFPLIANNPMLAYLDNAATSQKPQAVLQAIDSYYKNDNANVHRSIYALAERATATFENARKTVQKYINAKSNREIIFTRSATEGLNFLAWSLPEVLVKKDDIILVGSLEHHANFVPWQQAAFRKQAELLLFPVNPDTTLDMNWLEEITRDGRADRIKIVALNHVSNVFGTINPIGKIAQWCKERQIPLVLDAAQSICHMSLDVSTLGADFLAFSGHKVFAPMGSGVVWGKEAWLDRLPPWQTGGEMISSVRLEKTTWNDLPHKFEAGTPNVAGAAGLAAAFDWITQIGMDKIRTRIEQLAQYTYEQLAEIDNLILYGPSNPDERSAIFSFNIQSIHSHDISQFLDNDQIAIRSGHHCAQPAMRLLNIPSTARVSLAVFNTTKEIDRLIKSLVKIKDFFK